MVDRARSEMAQALALPDDFTVSPRLPDEELVEPADDAVELEEPPGDAPPELFDAPGDFESEPAEVGVVEPSDFPLPAPPEEVLAVWALDEDAGFESVSLLLDIDVPMSTSPRNVAPSSRTTRGALISPFTWAEPRSTICSWAVRSPSTRPSMVMRRPMMSALTRPSLPTPTA